MAVSHVGGECGILLDGTLEFSLGDERHILEGWDSISFDSSIPHSWRNLGECDLEVIWVITPPHY
jgi:quercetin dioxygenase-like cupin family protein